MSCLIFVDPDLHCFICGGQAHGWLDYRQKQPICFTCAKLDFAEEYLKIRARIARIEKAIPRLDVIGLDIIDKLAVLREAIKP